MSNKRHVEIKILPDGRARIHYFVRDPKGPIVTTGGVIATARGPRRMLGAQGYIACRQKLDKVSPTVKNGIITPFLHSDDARAVTCDLCMNTDEYKEIMKILGETLETSQ